MVILDSGLLFWATLYIVKAEATSGFRNYACCVRKGYHVLKQFATAAYDRRIDVTVVLQYRLRNDS